MKDVAKTGKIVTLGELLHVLRKRLKRIFRKSCMMELFVKSFKKVRDTTWLFLRLTGYVVQPAFLLIKSIIW